MADKSPTQEDVRKARHTGFKNSLGHLPEDKRDALYQRYQQQDARREKNVSGFVNQIRSAK